MANHGGGGRDEPVEDDRHAGMASRHDGADHPRRDLAPTTTRRSTSASVALATRDAPPRDDDPRLVGERFARPPISRADQCFRALPSAR